MTPKNLWYIKCNNQVSGPFPTKLVSQRVLLGRLQLSDEVSVDRDNWLSIGDVDELVPDLLKRDQKDPFVQERIAAAKRWSDDRGGSDRRDFSEPSDDDRCLRSGRERREIEGLDEVNYREGRGGSSRGNDRKPQTVKRLRKSYTPHTMILLLVVIASSYATYMYWPRTVLETANNCEALPGPNVDWSNCNLQGVQASGVNMEGAILKNANLTGAKLKEVKLNNADLSYSLLSLVDLRGADLSNSNLVGVNLRNSNLTGVNLSNSNLSYANFSGATLFGVDFQGAILEKTIWSDGQECAVGSIGVCN